jgi:hypothetical protein
LGIRGADFGIDDSTFVLALRTRGAGQWFYVGRQPWAIREVGPDSLSGPGLLVHLTRATGSVVPVQGRIVGLRVSPDRHWAAYVGIAGRDSGSVFVGAIALDDGRGFVAAEDSGDLAMYEVGTTQPRWSPGNDWIYYARRVGPETTILRVQVAPGSGRRTRGPEIVLDRLPRNLDFDVTLDGRRLVYSAGTRRAAPYLLSWDGRGREAAALVSGTSSYRHSAMGPDGQAVAYVKRPEFELEYGAGDLYVRSLPGGPERLVARRAEAPIGWSPDGKQLAFFTSEGMGLRLVDVETGRVRAVGTRYGLPPSGLSWSPDGRTIVYQSNGAIVVHDTGGRALEIPALRPAALQSRAHPVFSPDGRRLAVLLPEGLGVHDLETGHTSVLSPESLMPLGWTPDGWVYAIPSRRETIVRLVRVPVTGGPSRVVAQSLNLRDCSDLTLAPRGGAVVCTRVEPATDIWLKDLVPGH